ncbi:uncharacterized protein JCM15063_002538 [Sporobolomyces koalae]|uniref:uncharacterized protein n=1 Tax=Sporobolomyces koalae TaxID=500713 RepID=UPI003177FF62
MAMQSPPRLTLPLLLVVAPLTCGALAVWPMLALGSFIPVVGLFSLTSLLTCTAFIYLALPATLHLLFSQDHRSQKRFWLPFRLPRLPLFAHGALAPMQLTHTFLRLVWQGYRASLLSLFFDSIAKRILILGGLDSAKILKENIVYLAALDPGGAPSKRLNVYFPDDRTRAASDSHAAPVIVLITSPSYRFLSSKQFPSAQIALRLRRLGYCVVVPDITSFPDADLERMVYELRECLKWVMNSISSYRGDKERVWILGQGAGAHIAALTVVQSAVVASRNQELSDRRERDEARTKMEHRVEMDSDQGGQEPLHLDDSLDLFLEDRRHGNHDKEHRFHRLKRRSSTDSSIDSDGPASITSRRTVELPPIVEACRTFSGQSGSHDQPETHGMSVSNWGEMRIRGLILSGGCYDVVKQLKRERELGLSEVSALQRICGRTETDAELASPCHLLYAASSLLAAPSTPGLLPPNVLLVHGGRDHIVPYSQSVLFKNLLVGVGLDENNVELRLYREESGIGSLTSLMHSTKYSGLVLSEIESIISNDSLADPDGRFSIATRKGTTRKRERSRRL